MSGTEGSPEDLQRDIEAQREHLAQTVDQLAAKLDVKSQAQAKLAQAKDAATTADGRPRPEVLAGLGVALAALVGATVLTIRRRRS